MWALLTAGALLWPSRLAGPLDGAPLDGLLEALVIGLALPTAFAIDRAILHRRHTRAVIAGLIIWKILLVFLVVPDGWCARFTSPRPLFVGNVTVPHTWDVRADWLSDVPRCSAIITRAYRETEEFPVWFYNLPPANLHQPSDPDERPPLVSLQMDVSGSLYARGVGVLQIATDPGVALSGRIDQVTVDGGALAAGVPLTAGPHAVAVAASLTGEHWRFDPQWNGRSLWSNAAIATRDPAGIGDRLLRPWGGWVTTVLVLALLLLALAGIATRAGEMRLSAATIVSSLAAAATSGSQTAMRVVPLMLGANAILRVPPRLRNIFGAQLLIGVPFLVMIGAAGAGLVGRATWYSIGDDWWMFQRFAYRIYLQHYWLEGGEAAFWFQPLYRWIAGGLHLVFGDSSIGELFWDGACVWTGALFAFHITRSVAGFRWGIVAAVATLASFTIGPTWYLFGRGLSEITSAGLVYGAILLLLRGRRGAPLPLIAAGVCIALAFYTRLNNLIFATMTAAFCLPVRQRAGDWMRVRTWWPRCSRHVVGAVVTAVALAIILLSVRAYHYTGSFNPLAGTQASARSIWQTTDEGLTPVQNLVASLLLVTTMTAEPHFEPRALPIALGLVCAILALAGVRRFRELPMNVTLLCLAGFAGALVAKGSAYPGRFSVHLIPVTVTLVVCMLSKLRVRGAAESAS